MLLVVGLGNPGKRYAETRHNVGFDVVEELARRYGPVAWREKFSAQLAEVGLPGHRSLLVKPQTFMNLSGNAVRGAAAFYKVDASDILVVHDDLDIPFGQLRLKVGGGSGGHNGLKSVTQELGTADYGRLRVGIGRPPPDFRGAPSDFVLQAFAPEERGQLPAIVGRAADAVTQLAQSGMEAAMNETNRRR